MMWFCLLLMLVEIRCHDNVETRKKLILMSYNVKFVPKYLVADRDQITRAQLLTKAKFLRSNDILCLQEVFQPEPTEILLDALTHSYPYRTPILGDEHEQNLWDETWNRDVQRSLWKFLSGGLTILSKWPILYAVQYFYQHSCSGHRFVRVGFIYAKILYSDEKLPIHLIGTHLQPDDAPGCYPSDQSEIREKQMKEIRIFIDQRRINRNELLFILGDFNVDRHHHEQYETMIDLLHVQSQILHPSSLLCSWDSSYNAMTHTKHHENQLLDYIFISNDHQWNKSIWFNLIIDRLASEQWHLLGRNQSFTDTRNIPLMELSDHYPIVGFFNMSEYSRPYRRSGVITYVRLYTAETNRSIVMINENLIISNSSNDTGTLFILTNNGTPRRHRCLRSEQNIFLIDAHRPLYYLSDTKSLRMKFGIDRANRYLKIIQINSTLSSCLKTNSTFILQSQLRSGLFYVNENQSHLCLCTTKRDEALSIRLIEVQRKDASCRITHR